MFLLFPNEIAKFRMKLAEHDTIGRQAIVSALTRASRKDARRVRKQAFEAAQSAISSLEHASAAVNASDQLFEQLALLRPYTSGILVSRKRKRREAESDAESGMYSDSSDDFEQAADTNLVDVHRRLRALSSTEKIMLGTNVQNKQNIQNIQQFKKWTKYELYNSYK